MKIAKYLMVGGIWMLTLSGIVPDDAHAGGAYWRPLAPGPAYIANPMSRGLPEFRPLLAAPVRPPYPVRYRGWMGLPPQYAMRPPMPPQYAMGQPMPPQYAMRPPMPPQYAMGQPMPPQYAMRPPMPPQYAMGEPMPPQYAMRPPMPPQYAMGQPMPPQYAMRPPMPPQYAMRPPMPPQYAMGQPTPSQYAMRLPMPPQYAMRPPIPPRFAPPMSPPPSYGGYAGPVTPRPSVRAPYGVVDRMAWSEPTPMPAFRPLPLPRRNNWPQNQYVSRPAQPPRMISPPQAPRWQMPMYAGIPPYSLPQYGQPRPDYLQRTAGMPGNYPPAGVSPWNRTPPGPAWGWRPLPQQRNMPPPQIAAMPWARQYVGMPAYVFRPAGYGGRNGYSYAEAEAEARARLWSTPTTEHGAPDDGTRLPGWITTQEATLDGTGCGNCAGG